MLIWIFDLEQKSDRDAEKKAFMVSTKLTWAYNTGAIR